MSLIIVVGTSRCGSTMLSKILGKHPEVLSLSEFWNCFMDSEGSIPDHDMSGAEFWQRITNVATSYDDLVRAGIKQDDDLESYQSRFNFTTGVPPICHVLGMLTGGTPDLLYDQLAPQVSAWPTQSTADHCRALFADLAARLGRTVIVERTGGSINYLEQLREMFPEARFVFLHRSGPDTALSMSRYPTLRLAAIRLIAEAIGSSASGMEMFPAEVREASPEDFNGLIEPPFDKERFLAFPIPLVFFGWFWSYMTRNGTAEIRKVRRDRWVTLRYEPILTDTRHELTTLAGFMGVRTDPQWLDWTCKFVVAGRSGSAAAQLHPGDLAPLRAACAAGERAFDLVESEPAAPVPDR